MLRDDQEKPSSDLDTRRGASVNETTSTCPHADAVSVSLLLATCVRIDIEADVDTNTSARTTPAVVSKYTTCKENTTVWIRDD